MTTSEKHTFEITVTDQEAMDVVGISNQINMKNTGEVCEQLWTDFSGRMKEVKWSGKEFSLGISLNNNAQTGDFDYVCAVPIDNHAPVP